MSIKLDEIIVDEGISGSGEKTNKRDGYNSMVGRSNNPINFDNNQELKSMRLLRKRPFFSSRNK